MKSKIFVLCHKDVPYEIPNDSLHTSICCGVDAGNNCSQAILKDNDYLPDMNFGNFNRGFSKWNGLLAEQSAIFSIYSRALLYPTSFNYDVVGFYQYRRRLKINTDEIEQIFSKGAYDAIVPVPIPVFTVKEQYAMYHNIDDLNCIKQVAFDLYPEYREDWIKYIDNGKYLYYSSGFIFRKDDFMRMYEFLFNIFNEYVLRVNSNSVDDVQKYVISNTLSKPNFSGRRDLKYQMQILGFLGERLQTLYFQHNFKKMFQMRYILMENNAIM